MNNHEIITSEDYIDLVVEYTNELASIVESSDNMYIFHSLGGEYRILHIHKSLLQNFLSQMEDRIKYEFPVPMGIMEDIGLSESGIERIHSHPYMQLRGAGVVIAVIDTGIDYLHPAFIYPNRTTKILRIWDQTINGTPPVGYQLGHEFTSEDINRALQSEDPYSIVEHRDNNGHGTFISGIVAGYDRTANFIGVAPEAELIIVKIKPAKQNFKEQWMILKEDAVVYQTSDIVLGLRYAVEAAARIGKPLAANNSFGTNSGPHDNSGISGITIEDMGHRRGVVIVSAAGNEGIAKHHASGTVSANTMVRDVELKVGDNEKGFCLEIWIPSPDIMSIRIKTPLSEYVEMLLKKNTGIETTRLMFERTEITIEYDLSNYKNGDQFILVKLRDPTPGIWIITLRSHIYLNAVFHTWLPIRGWIQSDTQFLDPDPNYTITMPGTFSSLITVGAYNHRDGSLYVHSSRGPSRLNIIRPDLVAPGVDIIAPWPNNAYTSLSGTSIASAIVTGCAALLLEWGIVQKNDPSINTYKVKSYLTGGAVREKNVVYPNNIWGYGKLDLYGAFNMMNF